MDAVATNPAELETPAPFVGLRRGYYGPNRQIH
jgi:hypothetical protein